MPSADSGPGEPTLPPNEPEVRCEACQAAVESGGGKEVSFLLLDQLTIPVLSCADHLDWFATLCGLTTDDTADVLDHRPAGGVQCPGCRNARYDPSHVVLPVQDGAVVVLACPEHKARIVQRFQTGLEREARLTTDLSDTFDSLPDR